METMGENSLKMFSLEFVSAVRNYHQFLPRLLSLLSSGDSVYNWGQLCPFRLMGTPTLLLFFVSSSYRIPLLNGHGHLS